MRKTTCLLVVAISAGLNSAGVLAQGSQAGGVPALSDRVAALESQVVRVLDSIAGLQSSVAALQGRITTLEAADAALSANITKVANALAAEQSARLAFQQSISSQVATLEADLVAERNARIAADQSLADMAGPQILAFSSPPLASFLDNGREAALARLDQLPAGRYFFTAKANLGSLDTDHDWDCRLLMNGQHVLDHVAFDTEGHGLGGFGGSYEVTVLQSLTGVQAGSTVEFRCKTDDTPDTHLRDIQFIGIRVSD